MGTDEHRGTPNGRFPRRLLPLLWLCQVVNCAAKYQTGTLRIGGPKVQNHWQYVSKFGYATGTGKYNVRLQLLQPKNLANVTKIQFLQYLDEEWPEVEELPNVCDRPAKARKSRPIEIVPEGKWGAWVNGSLSQRIRPHIWYFALSDCNRVLQNLTHRVRFEIRAQQEGGSEFSVEMRGMFLANVLFLAGFTFFFWVFSQKTKAFGRSAGSVHPVIWALLAGMILQYIAQVFHTVHLWRYSFDGSGVKALEVLSEIFFMLSQVAQTSLLILIALGYTLLQSRVGELDIMIPLCFMIGVIHIMLVGFGKIKDDASYKYHENEGVVGWILLIMRLVLYVWFLWAANSSANEGGTRLRSFLSQFRIAGSIYFLAYPGIFLVTKCFAPYFQHCVMSVGLMVMQLGVNVWLSTLFLTRGDYFKVSTLSSSELPGGTKFGLIKEE